MGMVVQHNMNASIAYNKLNANIAGLKKASEKLASGYRINRSADDAAGLAISEKMRSQIHGLNQAVRNSQDGINMIQTYEGAAQESHNILQRMKELAEEVANGTYVDEVDRDAANLEFMQLVDELNQIADTDFNGRVALNGGVMADGTIISNNKSVAAYPSIAYVQNGDDPNSFIYSERAGGYLDNSGSGIIRINGVDYEFKNGKSTIEDEDGYPKLDANIADGKITGKLKFKTEIDLSNPEIGKGITINGVTFALNKDGRDRYWIEVLKKGGDPSKNSDWVQLNMDDVSSAGFDFEIDLKYDEASGKITGYIENVFTIEEPKSSGVRGGELYDADGNYVGLIQLGDSRVSNPNAFNHARRNLTYSDSITLQTGARSKDAVNFTFEYTTSGIGDLAADMNISARGLGVDQLSLANQEKANFAIDQIDNAINKVSMVRATFGSIQNRLEHKIDNLTTTSTNLSEAESNIRDTDMANEMMTYTKFNILLQASQSMLAQANQQPQSVLQLLG